MRTFKAWLGLLSLVTLVCAALGEAASLTLSARVPPTFSVRVSRSPVARDGSQAVRVLNHNNYDGAYIVMIEADEATLGEFEFNFNQKKLKLTAGKNPLMVAPASSRSAGAGSRDQELRMKPIESRAPASETIPSQSATTPRARSLLRLSIIAL